MRLAAAHQVDTYAFGLPDPSGEAEHVLLPLLDLINHDGGANAAVTVSEDKAAYLVLALEDIRYRPPASSPHLSTYSQVTIWADMRL